MLCEVCEEREAITRCSLCGRWVCEKHIDGALCAVCRELMCSLCGVRLSVSRCLICGRLICRECSVELQPGMRICRYCLNRLDELIKEYPSLTYLTRFLTKKT